LRFRRIVTHLSVTRANCRPWELRAASWPAGAKMR
jgi:hypothetical protein